MLPDAIIAVHFYHLTSPRHNDWVDWWSRSALAARQSAAILEPFVQSDAGGVVNDLAMPARNATWRQHDAHQAEADLQSRFLGKER
jgi:hypothetical protein